MRQFTRFRNATSPCGSLPPWSTFLWVRRGDGQKRCKTSRRPQRILRPRPLCEGENDGEERSRWGRR